MKKTVNRLCFSLILGVLTIFVFMSKEAMATSIGSFIVTGGEENSDYSYDSTDQLLTVLTSKPLTITGGQSDKGIKVRSNVSANLILNEVYTAGLEIENSDAAVTLTLVNENQLVNDGQGVTVLKKGDNGKLIIRGNGKLSVQAENGVAIGDINQSVSNIEISLSVAGGLVCQGKTVAIGSDLGAVSNIKITNQNKGHISCAASAIGIGSFSGNANNIGIHGGKLVLSSGVIGSIGTLSGNNENIQIAGESTIVYVNAPQTHIEDTQRDSWRGLIYEGSQGQAFGSWKVYGGSFLLDTDLQIEPQVTVQVENGQSFTIKDGVTLTLNTAHSNAARIQNNGTLIINGTVNGKVVMGDNAIISGNGEILGDTNKVPAEITATTPILKTYTAQNIALAGTDYNYKGDGSQVDFNWYKDNNGAKGEALGAGVVPKDAGIYHVGITATSGRLYAAVTQEVVQKVTIEKANSSVAVTSNMSVAGVNKPAKLIAKVTGIHSDKPTGKVTFKIKKGSEAVLTQEVDVQNGQAVFDWTPKEKGDYSVTVKYAPATDGTGKNYNPSISVVFPLKVDDKGTPANPGGGSSSGGGFISANTITDNKKTGDKKKTETQERTKEKTSDKTAKKKEPKSVFKDVKTKDKSYQAIKFTVDKGLLKEKNHKFHPSKKITAKDVVSALYKMAGKAENKKASDKKDLVKAEAFLKETKILSEKDGDFVKAKEITKEQLIQLLYNYAEYKGYNTEVTGKLAAFKDSNKLSKRAEVAMTWALENGLITDKNNKLSPKNKVTRKELATILYNFLNKEETKKLNK